MILGARCIIPEVTQKIGIFILFFLFPLFNPVRAAVLINEIYPKTVDTTYEWVELYNTGVQSVSLDRWRLDHTTGDGKSFTLNASAIIQPHDFITLYGSQTAIAFSIDGDTVRLFDANNTLVDTKEYPGTLGYNTSMGRISDGGGGWAICTPIPPYAATPNQPNNCPPAPTPTATPIPTSALPTPTLRPTATPTPAVLTLASILPTPTPDATPPSQVLGAVEANPPEGMPATSPTDVFQFAIAKASIAYVLLGIAAAALSLMLTLWLRQRRMRKSKML